MDDNLRLKIELTVHRDHCNGRVARIRGILASDQQMTEMERRALVARLALWHRRASLCRELIEELPPMQWAGKDV